VSAVVAGSSNNVYGIDNDTGYVVWKRRFDAALPAATAACPGGIASATRIVKLDASATAASAGVNFGRGNVGYRSLLGEPGEGVPAEGRAGGAGIVLDHHRGVQPLGELLPDQAGEHVGEAAGRESDHDADRLVGPGGLGQRDGGSEGEGEARGRGEQRAAGGEAHGCLRVLLEARHSACRPILGDAVRFRRGRAERCCFSALMRQSAGRRSGLLSGP
jgi:hypothetical protein